MPLVETLPVGAGCTQWDVWGTVARIVVTDPARLDDAADLVRTELAAVDAAASRFRPDSEIRQITRANGRPVTVSTRLIALVTAALDAATATGGDVDPTLGSHLAALGYDRDFAAIADHATYRHLTVYPNATWRDIRVNGTALTVPAGLHLDLGATAKAWAADRCAALVAEHCHTDVLVALGGDIATAIPATASPATDEPRSAHLPGNYPDSGPENSNTRDDAQRRCGTETPMDTAGNGWRILIRDGADQPATTITLPAGAALATSSTISRSWQAGTRTMHHILDPRTGHPARRVWRTASVAAYTCVQANTLSTAAIVRGERAPSYLRDIGAPARLVSADGTVTTHGNWPAEAGRPEKASRS